MICQIVVFPRIAFQVVELTQSFPMETIQLPFLISVHGSMSLIRMIDGAEKLGTHSIAMMIRRLASKQRT